MNLTKVGWVEEKFPGVSTESIPMSERYFNSLYYSVMAVLMVGDEDDDMVSSHWSMLAVQRRLLVSPASSAIIMLVGTIALEREVDVRDFIHCRRCSDEFDHR